MHQRAPVPMQRKGKALIHMQQGLGKIFMKDFLAIRGVKTKTQQQSKSPQMTVFCVHSGSFPPILSQAKKTPLDCRVFPPWRKEALETKAEFSNLFHFLKNFFSLPVTFQHDWQESFPLFCFCFLSQQQSSTRGSHKNINQYNTPAYYFHVNSVSYLVVLRVKLESN